jgi:hypothetical protein
MRSIARNARALCQYVVLPRVKRQRMVLTLTVRNAIMPGNEKLIRSYPLIKRPLYNCGTKPGKKPIEANIYRVVGNTIAINGKTLHTKNPRGYDRRFMISVIEERLLGKHGCMALGVKCIMLPSENGRSMNMLPTQPSENRSESTSEFAEITSELVEVLPWINGKTFWNWSRASALPVELKPSLQSIILYLSHLEEVVISPIFNHFVNTVIKVKEQMWSTIYLNSALGLRPKPCNISGCKA